MLSKQGLRPKGAEEQSEQRDAEGDDRASRVHSGASGFINGTSPIGPAAPTACSSE
jgi:hypothetical protein